MWLLGGRKEESDGRLSLSSRGSKKSRGKRRKQGKHSHSQSNSYSSSGPATPASVEKFDKDGMLLAETYSGIEVSLSQETEKMTDSPRGDGDSIIPSNSTDSNLTGNLVISLKDQLAEVSKVYSAQFNVKTRTGETAASPAVTQLPKLSRPRKHRVPIFEEEQKEAMICDDILFLLRSHQVGSELALVKEELKQMNNEIAALQTDRTVVDKLESQRPVVNEDWDLHRQLELTSGGGKKLSAKHRARLQHERGSTLTVHLEKGEAQEALLSRCGCKPSTLKKSAKGGAITISLSNCREGGAGTTIQHLNLIQTGGQSAFLMSKDSGKSFLYNRLPDRLYRRMRNTSKDPDCADVMYLVTGSAAGFNMGSYYAEFRSGECWWGSADPEFNSICSDFDVYRVVFGAGEPLTDKLVSPSWIVIGRDGRTAWKNLPARLHNKLLSRTLSECGVSEVALGSGSSFFVRFLDGTTDWQLPSKTADVCQQLEREGRTITSISLHPDLPNDYIIRHFS